MYKNKGQMKERVLKKRIENCVDQVQEVVDMESAKAISEFDVKTEENYQWLDELKSKYNMADRQTHNTTQFSEEYCKKIDELEKQVDYLEKLADELEEFQTELEIKSKRVRRNSSYK